MKRPKKPKKKVMLVCGSGIVSSTIVTPTIEDILRESPYNCELIKGTIGDLKDRLDKVDLILTTVALPDNFTKGQVPIIVVTGLFSGEKERIKKEVLGKLQEE